MADNPAAPPDPKASAPAAPPAAAPAAKPAPKPHHEDDERIIIRPYPKTVFFYPAAVTALICGILTVTGGAQAHTLGFVFMCVFVFNLVIMSFEFTRYVSVAVVLSILVLVLLGVQMNDKLHLVEALAALYRKMSFTANAGFYFGIFGAFVFTLIGIIFDTRFDYWELRGNEVLHHHGFLGDVERFPAPSLKLKKEITDVFEYLLLFSGRLIIYPTGSERAIVLENVPRINVLEELITNRLHTLKVTVHTDG
jgi:hypothetical protein